MSAFSITTFEGRKCTAVPKANNVGGGRVAISTTSSSLSPATSTTSTFASTSISTTFSTSSTSIPSLESASAPLLDELPIAPVIDTSTSAGQETSTSAENFASSERVIPSPTSIPSASPTGITSTPASIPSSEPPSIPPEGPPEVTPSASPSSPLSNILAPGTETSTTPSATPTLDPTPAPSSQTEQDLGSSVQTSNESAPTTTSGTSFAASNSASEVRAGGTATATTSGSVIESANSGPGLTNGAQNNTTVNAVSTQTTVAVAGGVIGGLALISIIAFLLWFWRKRVMEKRRSTMLTPLSVGSPYGGGERGPYIISRNSLGPTSLPEKMKAVVGYNYQRLRGRVNSLVAGSPKPSVDLNRGNSQFGLPDTPASRSTSRAGLANNGAMTTKDRFVDWWGRLTEDGNFNWKLGNDPKSGRLNNGTYTSKSNMSQTRKLGSQPDFLTLLSMDEKQQQQGAASSNPRRSQSLGNDHFLGSLGLNFDTENPFSDSNAMSHDSAKIKPLAIPGAETKNPFSDANALPAPARFAAANNGVGVGGPATYVQNIRRSRGHSVSAANSRLPSGATAGRMPSVYRESRASVETSDTRPNRVRSDPFDLDNPELLAQLPGPGTRSKYSDARGLPNKPRQAHARNESFTSKYSSGVSNLDEWSEPGPDVGPAAGRWDTPSPDGALGRLGTGTARGKGGGGRTSVGKAM